jgi:2',3'-cyclic-nucleotide 2'-phosphodiesterase (5'-nucleotidase family)
MKLRIVTVNDVYVLDNLPRLRTLVLEQASVDPADVLLVTLPGDFLSPSVLSSLDAGRGMVECLNAVGVTHVTFGNHEDDLPTDELIARIHELRAVWLATNVRELLPSLPLSEIVDVAGVRVGLLGVVTNDPGVYRRAPFGGHPIPDANTAALAEIATLFDVERCALVIPLTHQAAGDDRSLARAIGSRRVPVILGGHEHEALLEQVGVTWLVKTGADAVTAAIVDIEFDGHNMKTSVRMLPLAAYAEDPELRARVDRLMNLVRELDDVSVVSIPEGTSLSSVGTRWKQTSMGTLVTSRLRDALGSEGALFNGGGIRGSRVYEHRLTYGALTTELPFDNEIVVSSLPGSVLADAIFASREKAPVESGAFLQVDDRMTVDSTHRLLAVAGEPLDEGRDYRIALVRNLFEGLDRIEPLVRFARQHPDRIPRMGSGRDALSLLTSAFAKELWRGLGGFASIDANGDARVTREELEVALSRDPSARSPRVVAGLMVRALDKNGDGVISPDETDDS